MTQTPPLALGFHGIAPLPLRVAALKSAEPATSFDGLLRNPAGAPVPPLVAVRQDDRAAVIQATQFNAPPVGTQPAIFPNMPQAPQVDTLSMSVPSGTAPIAQSFTFAELGMFGLHQAQISSAATTNDEAAGTAVAQAGGTSLQDGNARLPSDPNGLAGAQQRGGAAPQLGVEPELENAGPGLERESNVVMAPPHAPSFAAPQDRAAIEPDVSGLSSREAGGGMRWPSPPMRGTNAVNLVVGGPNEALTIVARGMDQSVEDGARLRRLFEETAADFGMDVAEFRLNGSATQPSSRSIAGEGHGSRTR
jgi:hypothetical protein